MKIELILVEAAAAVLVACPNRIVARDLSGDSVTHFDDNNYACYEWNKRAKTAISKGHFFAASNFKLTSPHPEADFPLKCNDNYNCARNKKTGVEYMIIDWCNPEGTEECTFFTRDHLDILVLEERDNVECKSGCDGFDTFSGDWDLVKCKVQLDSRDFDEGESTGDSSEFGK